MANRMRPWVKDVLVFAGAFTLSLISMGILSLLLDINPPPAIGGVSLANAWAWVFIAPASLAFALGWDDAVARPLAVFNPLFYGFAVWLVWRMVKLFWGKPAD